ncbi:LytTR family transcriptional regulator DNA-binding domain-containing protein [Shimia sp. R10_1]|uniref:MHYT domain-containing protein n=1 Tax=Shimia sp. R10_1 TaxID=2821095 RepID=UPI001ADD336A|nr:LytTR family transcriptional regulator DNA-binding domain-containing protein [Shimia sp. R10_1]
MLEVSHNPVLVALSLAVALMAGFTGFSLTRGASALPSTRRKIVVALSSVVLGGGVWSVHFIGMLGLQLPVMFFYDALITMISVLVAILVTGIALLLLHFRERTPQILISAGSILGIGVMAMHYIGMAGMQVCRPIYDVLDIVIPTGASVLLWIVVVWVAYSERTQRSTVLGTLGFGIALFSLHYGAVAMTSFEVTGAGGVQGAALDNYVMAMGVTFAVFLICGAFMLTSITFVLPQEVEEIDLAPVSSEPETAVRPVVASAGVPFEREGQTFFAEPMQIAAIRAEGHYTVLYLDAEKLFCPWSITEADNRLEASGFLRAHRSYLINPAHVSSFERNKDNGTLYFDAVESLPKVPVSRSRMAALRETLGL